MDPRSGRTLPHVLLAALVGVGVIGGTFALWPQERKGGASDDAAKPVDEEPQEIGSPRSATPPDAPTGRGDEESPPPESELPFRLLATVVRDDPARSIATLEAQEDGSHQVLSEGDLLAGHPGVRLRRIERGRILLDNEGVREQLRIDWSARAPAAAGGAPAPDEAGAALPAVERELQPAAPPPREPERGEADVGALPVGTLEPVYEEDELVGVALAGVAPDGLYARFGLREGDLLTAVNGVPLDGPDAVVALLREVAASEQLDIEVERADGTAAVLSVPTAALDEALRALE